MTVSLTSLKRRGAWNKGYHESDVLECKGVGGKL